MRDESHVVVLVGFVEDHDVVITFANVTDFMGKQDSISRKNAYIRT